jgi:hypothetical protein
MKLVHGNAAAHWLPSRHNFALFRLLAYLRLRNARPLPAEVILGIDRHQSNTETWTVTAWVTVMATIFIATVFAVPLALSFILAVLGFQVALITSGLTLAPLWNAVTRLDTPGVKVSSFAIMALLAAGAAYCTTRPTWVRFAGWQFLAMLALNAVAAVIVFLLRGPIAQLEATVGGVSSAP